MKGLLTFFFADDIIKYLRLLDTRLETIIASNTRLRIYEHLIVLVALGYSIRSLLKWSVDDLKDVVWRWSKTLAPQVHRRIQGEIDTQVDEVIEESFPDIKGMPYLRAIPDEGLSSKEIKRILQVIHDSDVDPRKGKLFAYVYPTGEKHEKIIMKAQNMFAHLNALNPTAFPSLRRMEVEVVQMSIAMLNGGPDAVGTMTTGGSESILMALKAYRDRARDLYGITQPEVVLPITAHPAFEKAGRYFSIKMVYVPINGRMEVDIFKMQQSINRNTILLVGSAPQYPHGCMDPIEHLAALARKKNLPLHVDSCVGGFFLPWIERAGYPVPPFDFRVDGVTSISADIHKYGYATKGSSVLLFKSDEYRQYQFMSYTGWPGGLFVSPSILGTRSGGNIAAAWASLVSHGVNGFQSMAVELMKTSTAIQNGIANIGGIRVVGRPVMTIISFESDDDPLVNIHAVGDLMQTVGGWKLERQHLPNTCHMTLSLGHVGIENSFLSDLANCVNKVRQDPQKYAKQGTAAMYSGISKVPLHQIADQFLVTFLCRTYRLPGLLGAAIHP
ncbi:hypothetical protein SAMD00019534_082510 [Acytostelium subglobosum LB1]|uniref:hypothetical protein n=1 Tax=Acytostelium subglobosum LB1 TaxID=1410327 RepID=UPI0006451E31|nr:hypothetical protein SAMD00019534_082510 [Acytostelium subglobosum LB1]GAM25076.1 hypothetical protein SAMD00019534_082510 [Acytostelium subglobosum LB1]|eukprot:XP_012752165.1 hypothetical protein SAMD00019534_082510 [Acytostelium subglobosum LB1]